MTDRLFHTGIEAVCLTLLLSCLTACGSKPQPFPPPPAPVENPSSVGWGFQQDGVRYIIETNPQVNYALDRPLAITVRVFQIKDTEAFGRLAHTADGIDALIAGKEFDGMLSSRVFSLQPNMMKDVRTDRLADARYLGVVAGYAHGVVDKCIAILPFAIHAEAQGLLRTTYYSAAKTDAIIRLGQESVTITGVERER